MRDALSRLREITDDSDYKKSSRVQFSVQHPGFYSDRYRWPLGGVWHWVLVLINGLFPLLHGLVVIPPEVTVLKLD
jgi:hypothetical protein